MSHSDLIWALETTEPKIDEEFVIVMLARSDDVSSDLLRAVLKKMTDEDIKEAYRLHLLAMEICRSIRGGDYAHGQEVSAVFDDRLKK